MMKRKIRFISFEGADGSGKTTILNLLKKYLEESTDFLKNKFIFTREPGGTDIGEKIRLMLSNDDMDIRTEALLFAASRSEHVNRIILPAIQNDNIVISDRFLHSSLAFQGIYKELGIKDVLFINNFGINKCYPDIVFFIDVPVNVSLERLSKRKDKIDRLDLTTIDEITKINNSYKKALKAIKESKIIIIDGNKEPNKILEDIINHLTKEIL